MSFYDAMLFFVLENMKNLNSAYKVNDIFFGDAGLYQGCRSSVERNLKLRRFLSEKYKKSNDAGKVKIIWWYISEWGGIRGNKTETIERYALSKVDDIILSDKGISSYSKALCIRDDKKYPIYDSRVALSLNIIQSQSLDLSDEDKIKFPIPTSQNELTQRASFKINEIANGWGGVKSEIVYKEYCNLLNFIVANGKGLFNIQEVEMLLFAISPLLAKKIL